MWNYFEVGHGKGPCDGIGGVVNRTAATAVKKNKAYIQDANDFFAWTQTQCESRIHHIFYTEEDYEAASITMNQFTPNNVPGTMKLHAIVPTSPTKIRIRATSCYCRNCYGETAFCDGWEELTFFPIFV